MTGAIGSGLVCYSIPIINHIILYFDLANCGVEVRTPNYAASLVCEESLLFNLFDEVQPDATERNVRRHDSLRTGFCSSIDSYPSFAEDGWSFRAVVVHMIIPALILFGGMLTSLAVLANFDYV